MPDEIIPHHKDELNLGKVSRDDITSRMALDLLAIKKDEVLDDGIIYFKCENLEKILRDKLKILNRPITKIDLKNLRNLSGIQFLFRYLTN